MKTRFVILAAACLALSGCAATKQEVSENLGNRFIGKNVDALVTEFGPPASSFRMNSGETSYLWQLSAVTRINTDQGSGTAKTNYCKVSIIASPTGTVTKLTTEDASGTAVFSVSRASTSTGASARSISGFLGARCSR